MNCGICKTDLASSKSYFPVEMALGLRDKFEYLECNVCGCLQIKDVPRNLDKYYPSDAYYAHTSRYAWTGTMMLSQILDKDFFDIIKFYNPEEFNVPKEKLNELVNKAMGFYFRKKPISFDDRILDVGCGQSYGFPLALADAGFTCVSGLDPSIEELDCPSELDSLGTGALPDLEGTGKWDIIMFNHSFEHVPDPLENLLSVAARLRPGGRCLLRMPTVSSWAWENYRENWFYLDAPRHLYIHSTESVRLLVQQAGLKLTDMVFDSNGTQYWASEQYENNVALFDETSALVDMLRSPYTSEDFAQFDKWAIDLNRSGRGDALGYVLELDL